MIQEDITYGSYSPLASTIKVEQTGPLQLTVRAGSFTTSGDADTFPMPTGAQLADLERSLDNRRASFMRSANPAAELNEINAIQAKLNQATAVYQKAMELDKTDVGEVVTYTDPAKGDALFGRIRIWRLDDQGKPIKPATYVLGMDQVIDLQPDPTSPVEITVHLGHVADNADIIVDRLILDGRHELEPEPDDWTDIHILVKTFVIPTAATSIDDIPIKAFTVLTGLPKETPPWWGQMTDQQLAQAATPDADLIALPGRSGGVGGGSELV